ncbi:MAG: helix-turn-helix transcriptional regulator [Kiritimatiellales bacterium]
MAGSFAFSALFCGDSLFLLPIILLINNLNFFVISCGNYPSLRAKPVSRPPQSGANQILAKSSLPARFKKTAGIPVGSYIQNCRINRAMALLGNTSFSITDVAEEAGFASPQAFSLTFKEKTGQTPRSYRNSDL